jgi:type III secretory pathway component EscT
MRVAPMIVTAPFFGARTPSPIKMGMLIMLTILFLPSMTLACKTSLNFNTEFIMLCGKELFIGFLLAFLISIPFYIAQSSGITIDFLRGSSSLQINDPTTQVQASDLGVLYNYLLIVIFYEVNGPFYFYSAMIDSYQIVPPDQWLSLSFFSFHHPVWTQLWDIVNQIMAISIQLAAPSLLAILMTETFLGIANRLAPQVQIAFLGMSLKSLVGLGILCLAWYFILEQMQKHTFLWLEKFYTLVLSLR